MSHLQPARRTSRVRISWCYRSAAVRIIVGSVGTITAKPPAPTGRLVHEHDSASVGSYRRSDRRPDQRSSGNRQNATISRARRLLQRRRGSEPVLVPCSRLYASYVVATRCGGDACATVRARLEACTPAALEFQRHPNSHPNTLGAIFSSRCCPMPVPHRMFAGPSLAVSDRRAWRHSHDFPGPGVRPAPVERARAHAPAAAQMDVISHLATRHRCPYKALKDSDRSMVA